MSPLHFRRRALLVALPLALAVALPLASSAALAQSSPGAPPEGTLPPRSVLGANPAQVTPAPRAAAAGAAACPAVGYGVNSSAPGSGKTVALTFDDGPGKTTSAILSILQQDGLPATFFNIGANQAARPALVQSEATLGIVLGNHTWDHPQMQLLSTAAQAGELDMTTNEQVALVGRAPCFFRPPYGSYNSTTLTLAQQRRMQVWNWNVDTLDWQSTSTVNSVVSLAESEGGALQHPVILMHNPPAGTNGTVAALPTIISYFASRGYRFVTLAGTPGLGYPGPAATATAGGLHVFQRAPAGPLTERTQTSGSWTGPVSQGGVLLGSLAATSVDAATSAAFVIGTDNAIWEQTITDAGASSGWTSIGGIATSRPAATTGANGVTTVAVRGADSAAWIRPQTAGTWGAWQPLGGVFNSALAVTATPGGGLAVAGVGTDNALWVRVETGTTWSAWQRVESVVNDDPALTVTPSGSLLAVVRGSDDAGWVSVGDPTGTTWSSWQTIGGVLASAPTVALVGSAAAVFVVGTNGGTFENVASDASTGSGWGGWQALP